MHKKNEKNVRIKKDITIYDLANVIETNMSSEE